MTEKRFQYNVNKNTIECDGKFVAYVNSVDGGRIAEKLNTLQKENEKLKQAITETEKMVQSTYDELTKLRCFKKNILRIKHSWDYLMEAIEYD